MKAATWLLIPVLSLTLMACSRSTESTNSRNVDNTAQNARDRDMNTLTPGDQSEAESDRKITQALRKELISDSTLSENGKNIKIITIKGVVTLRGVTATALEKNAIGSKAKAIIGVTSVDNQLDVKR